jgi:tetratricopeptide (TPR) repeat protein
VVQLQGHFDEARERYLQALEFYERIGAKRGIALASNNLGDLCWQNGLGDWPEAKAHWQRAEKLYEEIGDQRGLAIALSNLGEGYLRNGDLDAAEPPLRRARKLAEELGDDEIRDGVERALALLWAAKQRE